MSISTRTILKVLSVTFLFVGGVYLVYLARQPLVWLFVAAYIAVAINPLVEWFAKFMPRKSRVGGSFLTVTLIGGFILTMIMTLVPPLVYQTEQLIRNLPVYAEALVAGDWWISDQIRVLHLADLVQQAQGQMINALSAAGGSVFSVAGTIFSGFTAVLTVLVMVLFMEVEGPRWLVTFWKFVTPAHRLRWQRLSHGMYETVTGYVTGNLMTSLLAAGLTTIVLITVGVPYAVPLGMLVAILDFIPLVGATIAAIIIIVVSFFTSTFAAIVTAVFFGVYQQVENQILQPLIYGKTVQLSPLVVLTSVLVGASLGGILGAMVAIPVSASIQIIVREFVLEKLEAKHHAAKS
jgi:predicted PurR-regulated permease PerM